MKQQSQPPQAGIGRRDLLAVSAVLAAPAVRAQSLRKISFASSGGVTDAPLHIATALGYFAAVGLSVEILRLTSAPDMMAATATGQLDACGISATPGLFAAVQRGLKLRLVGDKQSIRPGFSATRLILRPGLVGRDEAAGVAGLRGRRIALSSRPSSVTMLLEDLLRSHGMGLGDVEIVELAYPSMIAALSTGAIDGAIDLEPYLTQAIKAGLAVNFCDFTAFVPASGGSIVPLVFSEGFIAERARAQDFMNCYVRGVRAYNDAFARGIERERMIDIIARGAGLGAAVVRDSYPAGIDPNQRLDRGFIDRMQQFFVRQKMLAQPTDLGAMIDPGFAERAVAALGPYV